MFAVRNVQYNTDSWLASQEEMSIACHAVVKISPISCFPPSHRCIIHNTIRIPRAIDLVDFYLYVVMARQIGSRLDLWPHGIDGQWEI